MNSKLTYNYPYMNNNISKSPVEIAKEISTKYNPKTLIPFPFEEIVKDRGDISILYYNLLTQEVSGAIVYENNSYKIIVNSSEMKERQYFTLAHEIGHYFLHKDAITNMTDKILIDGQDNYAGVLFRTTPLTETDRQREVEANEFAAELIMPSDKVKEIWEKTDGKLSVEYYAKTFNVSVSAMAIRMERLGLRTDLK